MRGTYYIDEEVCFRTRQTSSNCSSLRSWARPKYWNAAYTVRSRFFPNLLQRDATLNCSYYSSFYCCNICSAFASKFIMSPENNAFQFLGLICVMHFNTWFVPDEPSILSHNDFDNAECYSIACSCNLIVASTSERNLWSWSSVLRQRRSGMNWLTAVIQSHCPSFAVSK